MPKALPLSLPCRTPHSPFASSSSRSTIKISTPRGGACPVSPQIYCTSSVSTDSDSEPPSPSSPDTPVTAALAPRRRSPPPGTPRPVMRASLSRKRSNGTDGSTRNGFFGLGPDEDGESEYLLSVNLPGFMPEMVTVSARRDDRLAVIADMWHAESNCHHEWLVVFTSRDALVARARASFSADGTLSIRVPRRASSPYANPNAPYACPARSTSDPTSPGSLNELGLR